MKIEDDEAFKELLRIFAGFKGLRPPDQLSEWGRVDCYVAQLVESGWGRKDIFLLVNRIEENQRDTMPEECLDALSDYLTSLVGDVAEEYITRLPGETGNISEHTRYVRERKWME